ncbi:DUF7681 family protein [Crenobacter cavernae]|uniref:Uncharacterized protein n=1 Tax=Crenobacter cavernae TaxID=2290923 RepID=A0A345Y6T8_9NEIS|nr:hypothetical protein [Crenobacter cavernae]AXK39640.1 hypothetical protein DWG20_09390 [Crenobacter cavernae]
MDNQHRQIKGYRELNQEEIDLMNEIKAKGEEMRDLIDRVRALAEQAPAEPDAREADHPMYWVRYADGSFRSGLMYLTRAVARPTSF